MHDITVALDPLKLLARDLSTAEERIAAKLPRMAGEAGQDVVDYARYLFSQPKHGNPRVSKDGTGRIMIGSAPGEAPAIDTGLLSGALNIVVQGNTAIVNKQVPTAYAEFLEPTRPFMQPALDWAGERFYKNIVKLLQTVP